MPARAELSDADRQIYREAFEAARSGDWALAGRRADRRHDPLPAKVAVVAQPDARQQRRRSPTITDLHRPPIPIGRARWRCASTPRRRWRGVSDAHLGQWFDRFAPVTPAGKLQAGRHLDRRGSGAAGRGAHPRRSGPTAISPPSRRSRCCSAITTSCARRTTGPGSTVCSGTATSRQARRMMPRVDPEHRALADARSASRRWNPASSA